MRAVLVPVLCVWLSLMVVPLVSAGEDVPTLCGSNMFPTCECLEGHTYMVDCENFNLNKVPIIEADDYSLPWAVFLGDNVITEVLKLPQQDQLVKISLRHNPIKTIADAAFSDLPQLLILDLSHCRLNRESLTIDAFKGPFSLNDSADPLNPLELLDLSHNKIESLEGHAFMHLNRLKTLIISDNPFHDFERATSNAFHELSDIETLDLSRTHLKRIPEQFLSGMRKLKNLFLEGNNFLTVPQEVNFARSLQWLVLDKNPIVEISPRTHSAFHGPATLRNLSLSNMPKLERIQREAFTGLTHLNSIYITNNPRLENIDRLAFINVNNITRVFLHDNRLTTLSSEMLPWEDVETVDLQHNPWSCTCDMLWFADEGGLLDKMIENDPSRTIYINCAAPPRDVGQSMRSVREDHYPFECPKHESLPMNPNHYGSLIVVSVFISILFLVGATLLCTYVLYMTYKGQGLSNITVRYRRAKEADLESIAHNIEA